MGYAIYNIHIISHTKISKTKFEQGGTVLCCCWALWFFGRGYLYENKIFPKPI